MNCATIDKELLCVIATFHKFCSMLIGAELHVHTDHKSISSALVTHHSNVFAGSFVDEYSPTLHYVKGPCNEIADTFSCLSCRDDMSAIVGKKAITEDSKLAYYSFSDDKEIFNRLKNLPCLSSDKKQKQQ